MRFQCLYIEQWHRLLMFSAVILTIAGSVMIYIHSGGFIFGSPGETHMWFGFATVVLALLQPIGAFFRPHPGTSRRSIFNWLHWLAGNSAHILSSEYHKLGLSSRGCNLARIFSSSLRISIFLKAEFGTDFCEISEFLYLNVPSTLRRIRFFEFHNQGYFQVSQKILIWQLWDRWKYSKIKEINRAHYNCEIFKSQSRT